MTRVLRTTTRRRCTFNDGLVGVRDFTVVDVPSTEATWRVNCAILACELKRGGVIGVTTDVVDVICRRTLSPADTPDTTMNEEGRGR